MSEIQQSSGRKRPSLKFGTEDTAVAAETPAPAADPKPSVPPSRQGKKGVTFYLEPPGWKELRNLSMDTETSAADLMVEATNLLFEKYGRPRIAKR